MIFLIPLLTAFLFRLRGADKPWPRGQLSRLLCWAIPVGLLHYFLFPTQSIINIPEWWGVIAYPLAMWLGLAIRGWGEFYNITNLSEFAGMCLRGLLFTVFPALILYVSEYPWWVYFGGVLMGPAYLLAKYIPNVHKWLNRGPEWGEVIWGFVFGGLMVWTKLLT